MNLFLNHLRRFTLIELISVIAILGVLAAIIIPNISSFQKEADIVAVKANAKNVQTSVDMYSLDNYGSYPSSVQPTPKEPQIVNLGLLYPKQLRALPDTKRVKYWVDFKGKVWASNLDSPVNISKSGNRLQWQSVDGADSYNVYEIEGESATSSLLSTKNRLKYVTSTKETFYDGELNKTYAVNSVTVDGQESAPVGEGYIGFQNQLPVAIIGMNPDSEINTDTTITWGYNSSYDPDGDSISKAEWKVDDQPVTAPSTTLSQGLHKVELRVQDERGAWSEWATKEIDVILSNRVPTAVISYTPTSNITTITNINWSYSNSTDPDGDTISKAEWKLDGAIRNPMPTSLDTAKTYQVQLRVQDSRGLWSEWTTTQVTVSPALVSYEDFSTQTNRATATTATWLGGTLGTKQNLTKGTTVSRHFNIGDVFLGAMQDSQGNFVAVGNNYTSNDSADMIIGKYNPQLGVIREVVLTSTDVTFDGLTTILENRSGQYIGIGMAGGNLSNYPGGTSAGAARRLAFVKMDKNLNVLQVKQFTQNISSRQPNSTYNCYMDIKHGLQNSDGTYVAVGSNNCDLTAAGGNQNSGYIVLKVSEDLSTILKVIQPPVSRSGTYEKIIKNNAGRLVVAGYDNNDFIVTEFDSNLNKVNESVFGTTAQDYLVGIMQDSQGNYVLTGNTYGDTTSLGGTTPKGSYDIVLFKLNSNLQIIETYAGSNTNQTDYMYGAVEDFDGNYIVHGRDKTLKLDRNFNLLQTISDPNMNHVFVRDSANNRHVAFGRNSTSNNYDATMTTYLNGTVYDTSNNLLVSKDIVLSKPATKVTVTASIQNSTSSTVCFQSNEWTGTYCASTSQLSSGATVTLPKPTTSFYWRVTLYNGSQTVTPKVNFVKIELK